MLLNVVCFKGQWDTEFKKENTKEEEFWLNKVWSFIYNVCCAYMWDVKSKVIFEQVYMVDSEC